MARIFIELTAEEVEEIRGWYRACCDESMTSRSDAMFELLEKLDIPAEDFDLHTSLLTTTEQRAAITSYIRRHRG